MAVTELVSAFGQPETWVLEQVRQIEANGLATLTDGVVELVNDGPPTGPAPVVAVVPTVPPQPVAATSPPAPPSRQNPNAETKGPTPPRRRRR